MRRRQGLRVKKRKGILRRLKDKLSKVGTLNIILALVGIFFLWFNWQMMEMFKLCGAIPESYACAVIAAVLGECGVCGWIRTTKDKKQDRKWAKEDEAEMRESMDANHGDEKGE